jgi:hypothetical protein
VSGAAVWSLSLLVSCIRSLVWRVSLSDVAIPQVMLSSHFNFHVYLRIPHSYPPFLIICHHHYSLRIFAPGVSLSYNKHAFLYSRATHHQTTSSSSRPSLVSSDRQSNSYNPVSHLRSSTSWSFLHLGSSPRDFFAFNHR